MPSEEDTVEFDDNGSPITDSELFVRSAGCMRVRVGAISHCGKIRSENQDHYLVVRRQRSQEVIMTNMPPENFVSPVDESYAIVVADGVGGAAFGGLASQLALRTAWELGGRVVCWIMKVDRVDTDELKRRMESYASVIQQAFRETGESCPKLARMGTTWTSAYIVCDHAFVAHIGDSRAYLFRGGTAKRLTRDHTLAQDLLDAGLAPKDTAAYAHMLTRCFSSDSSNASPDVLHTQLEHGDRLLLCTDGLTDLVDDLEIGDTMNRHPEPQAACQALQDLALERGGKDNITVVIARVEALDQPMGD